MASEKWAGFTDEDIEKLKTNCTKSDLNNSNCENSVEIATKCDEIEKSLSNINNVDNCSLKSDVNPEISQFGGTWKIKDTDTKISISVESLNNCTCESYGADFSDESSESNIPAFQDYKASSERSLNSSADIHELEVFEARQKRIEAENARRRALINKAVMDKKKRTQAEANKLSQITDELKRLDSMLSADVSILRNYIEKASFEFSEAEKRYLRAEKELIEAKFLLFEKMQRKEQLTEHLCAIIEQNENRKANKLVELMKQLEMENIIEDFEGTEMQPILSKYCVMNDEAYHCCQTLRPTNSPGSPVLEKPSCDFNEQAKDSEHVVSNKDVETKETSTE